MNPPLTSRDLDRGKSGPPGLSGGSSEQGAGAMKVLMISIITAAALSVLSGGEEIKTQIETAAEMQETPQVTTLR
jgi:hypothetical protein